MKLLVHGRGIGPELGIDVHLAHFGVVEPVDDQHVGGQMAVAIALGDGQNFVLARVALLALDVAVGSLGQHGRGAGEQPVAGVDLVGRVAGDDKERNAVADLRGPAGLLVEAGLDGGLRGVVPQQAVALVGDQKRHAEAGSGGRQVVGPAADRVAAMIEKALVILAQAVVVLVVGRGEGRADDVELGVGGAAVVEDFRGAVLVVGHGLRPAGQLQQLLAVGRAECDVRAGSRAVEILRDVELGLERRLRGRMLALHGGDHPRRLVDVGLRRFGLASSPRRRARQQSRSRARPVRLALQAQRHAQNVRRIGLKDDGLALAVEFEPLR